MTHLMRISRKAAMVAAIALVAAAITAPPALAQALYGAILGTIADQSGAPVPGATVTAVNDAPTFTIPAAVTVGEDAGGQTNPAFATGITAGPANEAGQTLAFTVTVTGTTGNLAFTVAPAIDVVTGDLTFTAAPDTNGTAAVEVRLGRMRHEPLRAGGVLPR